MSTRGYGDDLNWGVKWERIVAKRLMLKYYKEQVYLVNNPTTQMITGTDIQVGEKRVGIEIKCRIFRYHKYGDILIETMANEQKRIFGWWYTSDAEELIYIWINADESAVFDGYEIDMQNPELREWFEHNKAKFEYKQASTMKNGIYHTTGNRVVSIKDFPTGTIRHIPIFETKISQIPIKPISVSDIFE